MGEKGIVVLGQKLGAELCQALGLDSGKVTAVKIEAEVNHAAVITIKSFIHDPETTEIVECLEKYYLVAKAVPDEKRKRL